jgi:hypothetical protein
MRQLVRRFLIDPEFFGIPIKHKPLTRNESHVQKAPAAFDSLARDAINKGMAFQHCTPNVGETASLS